MTLYRVATLWAVFAGAVAGCSSGPRSQPTPSAPPPAPTTATRPGLVPRPVTIEIRALDAGGFAAGDGTVAVMPEAVPPGAKVLSSVTIDAVAPGPFSAVATVGATSVHGKGSLAVGTDGHLRVGLDFGEVTENPGGDRSVAQVTSNIVLLPNTPKVFGAMPGRLLVAEVKDASAAPRARAR